MRVEIDTILHSEQRYPTVGDYWIDENGTLQIKVSDMGNADYEFLIAIHELIEAYFCLKENVNYDDVTKFDKHFEDMREAFPDLVGNMEAGDSEVAPYNRQHKLASMFEKWVADNMKVDWEEYNNKVDSLVYEKK